MAKDVLITPLDGIIQFSSSAGSGSGAIQVDGDNLVISNALGDVLLGDGASDIYIGDGTNNVDIIFEQNGEIQDDGSGKSITLGSKTTNIFITGSSTIAMQKDGGNVGIGTTTATKTLEVAGDISASGDLFAGSTTGAYISASQGNLEVSGGYAWIKSDDAGGESKLYLSSNVSNGGKLFYISAEDASTDQMEFNIGRYTHTWQFKGGGNTNPDHTAFEIYGQDATAEQDYSRLRLFSPDGTIRSQIHTSGSVYFNPEGPDANFGIGTTSPVNKLQVAGAISSSGDLTVGNQVGSGVNAYGTLQVNQPANNDENGIGIVNNDNGRSMRLYCSSTDVAIINSGDGGGGIFTLNEGAGNVGLGITTPTEKLQVAGNISASGYLSTESHITASGNISSSGTGSFGKVAIGRTTPVHSSTQLSVDGGISGYDIARFTRTLGGTGFVGINANSSDPQIRFYEGSDYAAIGVDATNSNLVFATGSKINGKEAMVMDTSGNFGIGTTSPTTPLQVDGTISGSDVYAASSVRITMTDGSVQRALSSQSGVDLQMGDAGINDLRFKNAVGTAVTIKDSGNVGIGATSPTSTLHISGAGDTNVLVEGHITASGNISASGDIFAQDLTLRDDGISDDHPILHLRNDTRSVSAASAIRFSSGSYDNNPATTPGSATISHNPTTHAFLIQNNSAGNLQLGTSGSARVTIAGDGGAQFTGNITASGDISSSGGNIYLNKLTAEVEASKFETFNGSFNSNGSDVRISSNSDLQIDATNVGIGTTKPTKKLVVAGDISASGYLSTESHITASGDISSSGTIISDKMVIGTTSALQGQELSVIGEVSASSTISSKTGFVGHIQETGSYDFPGAIVGYNAQGVNVADDSYDLTTGYAHIDGDNIKVQFVAPKSGNVEIEVNIYCDGGSTGNADLFFGLTSNLSVGGYSALASYHEHNVYQTIRNAHGIVINKWVITGLTPGTTYKYFLAAKVSSTGGTPKLYWGGNTNDEYPPVIMKATALPSNADIET